MARYNLILVPESAVIPEDLRLPVVPAGDIVGRIAACEDQVALMPVNSRELQILVEYRDLLDVDVQAVVGLQGAMYNTIWNTYVSTMKRTTVDALLAKQQENADMRAVEGQRPVVNPDTRRAALGSSRNLFADAPSPEADVDDSKTGDLG